MQIKSIGVDNEIHAKMWETREKEEKKVIGYYKGISRLREDEKSATEMCNRSK